MFIMLTLMVQCVSRVYIHTVNNKILFILSSNNNKNVKRHSVCDGSERDE